MSTFDNKQIFHAFCLISEIIQLLFNIDLINIQRREAKLNIVLLRVNNFIIKQKKAWIWEDNS